MGEVKYKVVGIGRRTGYLNSTPVVGAPAYRVSDLKFQFISHYVPGWGGGRGQSRGQVWFLRFSIADLFPPTSLSNSLFSLSDTRIRVWFFPYPPSFLVPIPINKYSNNSHHKWNTDTNPPSIYQQSITISIHLALFLSFRKFVHILTSFLATSKIQRENHSTWMRHNT